VTRSAKKTVAHTAKDFLRMIFGGGCSAMSSRVLDRANLQDSCGGIETWHPWYDQRTFIQHSVEKLTSKSQDVQLREVRLEEEVSAQLCKINRHEGTIPNLRRTGLCHRAANAAAAVLMLDELTLMKLMITTWDRVKADAENEHEEEMLKVVYRVTPIETVRQANQRAFIDQMG
jgi:hypothetical protein